MRQYPKLLAGALERAGAYAVGMRNRRKSARTGR